MTVIPCPHCGAAMNAPLKFCISCGRAISPADLQKLGGVKTVMKGSVTKKLEDYIRPSSFGVSRKSHSFQRDTRQILFTLSIFLFVALLLFLGAKWLLESQPAKEVKTPTVETKPMKPAEDSNKAKAAPSKRHQKIRRHK